MKNATPVLRNFENAEEFFCYITESPHFSLHKVEGEGNANLYRERLKVASKNIRYLLGLYFPYLKFSVNLERSNTSNSISVEFKSFNPEKMNGVLDYQELKKEIKRFYSYIRHFQDQDGEKGEYIYNFRKTYGEASYVFPDNNFLNFTMEALHQANERYLSKNLIKNPSKTPSFSPGRF